MAKQVQTRSEQLAAALLQVARVNHYMIGIVEPHTVEELDAAEQILITAQNAGKQSGAVYQRYELALDLVAQQRRGALPGWAVSRD